MFGWHLTVYRTTPTGEGEALATWRCGPHGLSWLQPLIERGDAQVITQNGGYPDRYRVRAGALQCRLPALLGGARVGADADGLAQCSPEEWVVLEAWDEN